jgi:hypothetical protein
MRKNSQLSISEKLSDLNTGKGVIDIVKLLLKHGNESDRNILKEKLFGAMVLEVRELNEKSEKLAQLAAEYEAAWMQERDKNRKLRLKIKRLTNGRND